MPIVESIVAVVVTAVVVVRVLYIMGSWCQSAFKVVRCVLEQHISCHIAQFNLYFCCCFDITVLSIKKSITTFSLTFQLRFNINYSFLLKYLLQEREDGLQKLNALLEAGEKLIPNTGTEGREVIRQQNQSRKQKWETLFEDLSGCQRKLELALLQWVSFEDHNSQIDQWLKNVESQIEGNIPLMSTLEEKKLQLQTYKVISSYLFIIC